MKRILLLFTAVLSSLCTKLKEIVLPLLQDNSEETLSNKIGCKNRGSLKTVLFSVILLFAISFVNAQTTYYSIATGIWNSNTTWSTTSNGPAVGSGIYPLANDIVVLDKKFNVTLTQTESCASLTINGGPGANNAQISINTFTLNVFGNITISGGTDTNVTITTGVLNVGGNFDSGATFTAGTGTVNYNKPGSQTVGNYTYNNLTLSGSGVKTFAVTSVTNNLTLSGTAIATTTANLSVGGILNIGTGTNFTTGNNFILGVTGTTEVSGTLTLGGTGAKTFTGNATINSVGIWSETGVAAINYAGNLQNDGTYTASTGIHTFTGTGKTISGANAIGIPSLTVSGTTSNNGTLTVSTALSGGGTLTNLATRTLNIGGASGITTLTATVPGNIVNYNGAAQTVKATTYSNLTLSGSGAKTTTGITVNGILSMEGTATASAAPTFGTAATLQYNTSTARTTGLEWPSTFSGTGGVVIKNTGVITLNNAKTISNSFSIETSAKADLGAFTHFSNGLILGGLPKSFGSWGSDISVAPNKADTFFAATGIINVSSSSCVSNLITNGNFTNAATGNNLAVGWTFTPTKGTYVETYPEDTYFSNGNSGYTAELDSQASLRQTVTVVPNVSYTVSFIYARRSGTQAPSPSGVTIAIIGGTLGASSLALSTSSLTPEIGTFTFTPTSASITLDFYNHLATNQTYGTIIDNIVLVPSSQVTPFATTIPKGNFNTLLSCAGTPVQLDVDNVPTSGVTYSWTGSAGATFSAPNIKNPIVTFTGTGLKEATVNVTTAAGCITTSTTYVNLNSTNGPTITTAATPAVVAAVCQSATAQTTTMAYTATTNTPTSYRIDWDTLVDQSTTSQTFQASGSSLPGIIVPVGTPAGTYTGTLIITNANCSSTKTITLTVNSLPQGSLTANGPFCTTGSGQLTWAATAGAGPYTVIYNDGVANRTVTNVVSGTPFATFTTPVTATTTYTLVSVANITCIRTTGFTGGSASITVNALPAAPAVGTITDVTCSSTTGSVVLSGLQNGWVITQSGTALGSYTALSTIYTVTGLAAGNYTFTVNNGICTSLPTANVPIADASSTTWNGSSWSNGLPAATKNIIIASSSGSPFATDMSGCALTINTGVAAAVPTGVTLTITNAVTTNGTLTFENSASLVQINNVSNVGSIRYKRVTGTVVRVTDYTYWSSPVSPLNLAGSTGGILYNPSSHIGSRFFSFLNTVAAGDWKSETAATQMVAGRGYIIRGPNTIPTTPLTFLQATFEGVPNNGTITLAGGIIANRSYLLGNPYPSAIDADKFLTANSTVLDGTLYFWTHRTEIGTAVSNPGSGFFAYSSDDYSSYNKSGGVGTVANSDPDKSVSNPARPTGKIGAGQGFFAATIAVPTGSSIVFNNEMRTGLLGAQLNNSQFFRTSKSNSKTTIGVEKNRIWLNLTNSGGAFKQLLVGYIAGATNDYDISYDGSSFSANKYIDFYSVLNGNVLTIQGRALPFDPSDLVPLGYVSTIPGEFSISIDEVDGALKSQDVFMEDKMLDIVHDLKVSPYKFITSIGTFNDRFVLRYSNRTLGNDNFNVKGNSITVSKYKDELEVKSQLETIRSITVFDLLGKKVLDQDDINSNEFRSLNAKVTNQTVIVKITLTTGIVISKKVAF